jgi:endonuclease YncB( thermonuclease family)
MSATFVRTLIALALAATAMLTPARETGVCVDEVDVVAVADGDTVYVQLEGVRTRVRLASIDAPEHKQAFGQRSEQSLRELVWKKRARMTWRERDRHGRPIVRLDVDGFDVNAEQVRRGMAWVYLVYSRDPDLLRLEDDARASRRGLWADPAPVPPWEWRKTHPRGAGSD